MVTTRRGVWTSFWATTCVGRASTEPNTESTIRAAFLTGPHVRDRDPRDIPRSLPLRPHNSRDLLEMLALCQAAPIQSNSAGATGSKNTHSIPRFSSTSFYAVGRRCVSPTMVSPAPAADGIER
jgi:hypothetical protein